nr:MAG TPA: hypothetical protein [Caudoviricetes sp.]
MFVYFCIRSLQDPRILSTEYPAHGIRSARKSPNLIN